MSSSLRLSQSTAHHLRLPPRARKIVMQDIPKYFSFCGQAQATRNLFRLTDIILPMTL